MPEAFKRCIDATCNLYRVSSQKITTPLCHGLVASISLPLCSVPRSSSRSNVPFLWRTIRGCPRDRFYFAPWHLSYPVTVEHCFLWRSMLDVPIALRFSLAIFFPFRNPPPACLSRSPVCFPVVSPLRYRSGDAELKEWKIEG